MHYKYIILSDLHLGSSHSNPKKLLKFLKSITFDNLILNGDIIDGWKIKRGGKIKPKEIELLKYILKLSKKVNVIYLRGNHDDFLDHAIPIQFGDISILDQYDIEIDDKRYYVIHGDIFDRITKELKWVAQIGDIGYNILIKINKLVNRIRKAQGKSYYSFSKEIKKKVKKAVNYISDFEENLAKLAKSKGYDGIMCGHIHHPEIRDIGGIMYYNSGDWVESMSALVFSDEKGWEIIEYIENN
jgi:UDP-2,3-diacylglucosamine pyrophosphatase LpxH